MNYLINWQQVGATAAIAAAISIPIYGSGGQVNTLAGRYNAPLALAVGTGVSSILSQLVIENYNPITSYDIKQGERGDVVASDLMLYSGAVTGAANAAMYMNDRPGAAAVVGVSSQILGNLVATSLFDRK
jgi:hypothetical protein